MIQSSKYKIISQPAEWLNYGALSFCSAHISVNEDVPIKFVNQLKRYVDGGQITLHTSRIIPTGEVK